MSRQITLRDDTPESSSPYSRGAFTPYQTADSSLQSPPTASPATGGTCTSRNPFQTTAAPSSQESSTASSPFCLRDQSGTTPYNTIVQSSGTRFWDTPSRQPRGPFISQSGSLSGSAFASTFPRLRSPESTTMGNHDVRQVNWRNTHLRATTADGLNTSNDKHRLSEQLNNLSLGPATLPTRSHQYQQPHNNRGNPDEHRSYPGRPSFARDHPAAAPATNTSPLRVFRPMESKLPISGDLARVQQSHHGPFPPQNQAWARMLAGFSPNYRGNIALARNRSADIPAHQNCSLFILNLPADITTHELLANIRDAGRIFATHINAPEPDKGHGTCAAKVIFFERAGAERLYERCREAGFALAGRAGRGRVIWNRIRTAEQGGAAHLTRVLQIAGPEGIVNEGFLTAYFQTKLDFQVDEVLNVGTAGGRSVVEYRFGSFRCQSEAARMALAREWSEHDVKVWFGPDPCDVARRDGKKTAGMVSAEAEWRFSAEDKLGTTEEE